MLLLYYYYYIGRYLYLTFHTNNFEILISHCCMCTKNLMQLLFAVNTLKYQMYIKLVCITIT